MSIYIPLAAKYRPQKFSDVIGQDITIKIITNGLQKNRLGAAMLFSGTRGVGKTTIARILAKAFRCENSNPEPCCKCESCIEFSKNNQIDVIEIDAASNTSVDDVREIIESCRYKPTTGKFKVFIIDEVHMLSKSAFNALLKTLEEPPEHVKFLLATTETHKIPETILSRVLKFDLKKIDVNLITQYLSSICNQENIIANLEVLSLIAKAAEGSIRDGLSILDQAINMADGNELSAVYVKAMLNFSEDVDIVDLLNLIISANVKSSIMKYRDIIKSDVSCEQIASILLDYIHALTCIKTDVEIIEHTISDELMPKIRSISKDISIAALSRMWQMLIRGIGEITICERPEIVLEMIIMRIAYASGLPDLQDIINGSSTPKCCDASKNDLSVNKINSTADKEISNGFSENLKHTIELNTDTNINLNVSTHNALFEEAVKMFPSAKFNAEG